MPIAAAIISIVGDQGGLVTRTNVEGPRNVVNACLTTGVRKLVHFSSIHAFEQRPHDVTLDETRANVEGPKHPAYDRSKAGGEAEIRAGIARGLDAVIVNPTAVLGPYDFKLSRMGTVVLMLAKRQLPSLVGGGFDWVDVRDVAAGAIAAAEKGRTGEKYLLSGRWASVKELAKVVQEVTGVKPPAFTSPMWLAKVGAPFMGLWAKATGTQPLYTHEALHALVSNRDIRHDKAAAELGYTARPLVDTVRDSVAWFRSAGLLPPA